MRGSTLLQAVTKPACSFIIWFENANHIDRHQAYTIPDSLKFSTDMTLFLITDSIFLIIIASR